MPWLWFALLSAFFAALTAILAKIGIRDVDSNVATAIRTTVVLIFAWGVVAARGGAESIPTLGKQTWVFLVLSGLATGMSWLFYFRALQLGPASRVAPIDKLSVALTITLAFIILGEKPTFGGVLGGALITAGVLVVALVK
ncbi:MAG: EamA family transporter [Acidobacteriota bacterium]